MGGASMDSLLQGDYRPVRHKRRKVNPVAIAIVSSLFNFILFYSIFSPMGTVK